MTLEPSSRLAALEPSPIRAVRRRAVELERAGRRILHLEIGEPDFDSPPAAKAAAKAALDAGRVHYTSNYGEPDLLDAISEKLQRDNGLRYDPDGEVVVTTGGAEGLLDTTMAFVSPGDEVIIPEPAWPHYRACVRLAGGVPVAVPTRAADGHVPDPDAVARAVTARTCMLVVNSPNNPTGAVYPADVLARLGDVAERHGLVVLSDEMYERLVHRGTHTATAAVGSNRERTVTLNGFSKAYAMTGWRLGYLAAPRRLLEPIVRVHQFATVCSPPFVQAGGVAAYRGDQRHALAMRDAFAARLAIVADRLAGIDGLTLAEPAGAFYAFPKITAAGWTSAALASAMLEQGGVALVPGEAFGAAGAGHLRVSYAASEPDLHEAFDRIADVLMSV